jgi:peptide/nickel transport system permease protein
VFAPFVANDRPLWYRGVNRFEFRESVRTLREVVRRLAETPSAELDSKTRRDLLRAVNLQVRLMRPSLPGDAQPKLDDVHGRILRAVEASDATALRDLRAGIQTTFGSRDLPLASRRFWPVLASLHWGDALFLTANVLLLTCPLWTRLVRRAVPERKPHRQVRAVAAVWFGLPALAAALWWWLVPARIDQTNYKAGVPDTDASAATALVVYESVLWPPIPYGYDEGDLSRKLLKPALFAQADSQARPSSPWDGPHWLGTNGLGRDILCRMIWGGRVSLAVGIVAVGIYVAIGIVVGAVAGYFRGVWDLVISRVIEVVICFPAFFLILTIVAFLGPGILNIMIVIGLTGWTGIARLIRGEFLRLVDQEFVLAGRALGYSPARLIFKHILPNAIAPVLVSATFGVAGAILTESALSFLGLGIRPPTPSWGEMLSAGRDAMFHAPWLIWFPGLAIFITITCYNLVGEALRDASDPRLRGSR